MPSVVQSQTRLEPNVNDNPVWICIWAEDPISPVNFVLFPRSCLQLLKEILRSKNHLVLFTRLRIDRSQRHGVAWYWHHGWQNDTSEELDEKRKLNKREHASNQEREEKSTRACKSTPTERPRAADDTGHCKEVMKEKKHAPDIKMRKINIRCHFLEPSLKFVDEKKKMLSSTYTAA